MSWLNASDSRIICGVTDCQEEAVALVCMSGKYSFDSGAGDGFDVTGYRLPVCRTHAMLILGGTLGKVEVRRADSVRMTLDKLIGMLP